MLRRSAKLLRNWSCPTYGFREKRDDVAVRYRRRRVSHVSALHSNFAVGQHGEFGPAGHPVRLSKNLPANTLCPSPDDDEKVDLRQADWRHP
jgi:hypothetical protein